VRGFYQREFRFSGPELPAICCGGMPVTEVIVLKASIGCC